MIHEKNTDIQTIATHPMGKVPTLHLSYHSAQLHYNSIIRSDNSGKSPITDFPIGHELKKDEKLVQNEESQSEDSEDAEIGEIPI